MDRELAQLVLRWREEGANFPEILVVFAGKDIESTEKVARWQEEYKELEKKYGPITHTTESFKKVIDEGLEILKDDIITEIDNIHKLTILDTCCSTLLDGVSKEDLID